MREGTLAYEDFDLATLVLSEVEPDHIRPRVDELMAPLRANPPLLEALTEYFARDMDVNATAEAMAPWGAQAGIASALLGTLQTTCGALASAVTSALADGTARPMAGVMFACALGSVLLVLPWGGRGAPARA